MSDDDVCWYVFVCFICCCRLLFMWCCVCLRSVLVLCCILVHLPIFTRIVIAHTREWPRFDSTAKLINSPQLIKSWYKTVLDGASLLEFLTQLTCETYVRPDYGKSLLFYPRIIHVVLLCSNPPLMIFEWSPNRPTGYADTLSRHVSSKGITLAGSVQDRHRGVVWCM